MSAANVEGLENRIILHFETLDQAMSLLSPWGAAERRLEATRRIHEALTAAGLSLEVRVKGRSIAEMGVGRFSGSLLRLLGSVCTPSE
jgi:hypothetical protein